MAQDENLGFWIQTASGGRFYYKHPRQSCILIEDIGHHLSQVGRFSGATRRFWSVAQHSVLVAWIIENELGGTPKAALKGLLHDGHEAFMNDIPTPFADHVEELVGWPVIEMCKTAFDDAIYLKICGEFVSDEEAKLIATADKIAFVTEATQLLIEPPDWLPRYPYKALDRMLNPVSCVEAEHIFMAAYKRLNDLSKLYPSEACNAQPAA
jgi:5'-deoxynucleotidase YfbR-like HD superfamily hydrolase